MAELTTCLRKSWQLVPSSSSMNFATVCHGGHRATWLVEPALDIARLLLMPFCHSICVIVDAQADVVDVFVNPHLKNFRVVETMGLAPGNRVTVVSWWVLVERSAMGWRIGNVDDASRFRRPGQVEKGTEATQHILWNVVAATAGRKRANKGRHESRVRCKVQLLDMVPVAGLGSPQRPPGVCLRTKRQRRGQKQCLPPCS